LVTLLAGCAGFGDSLDSEDRQRIDTQIRESIEKTFPLPEAVIVRTHIGDDLRFSTGLSVGEVVSFYRESYTAAGYLEEADSLIRTDGAALTFKQAGEKDVLLEATQSETGSDVHLQLKSPAP
jgi:hypothetical protein